MVRIKNIPDTITSIDPDMWVAVDRDDDAEESGKARASTLSAFVNDQLSPLLDITEGVGVTIDKTNPQNPVITADQGGGNMFSEIYDPQGISNDAFARENHTGTQPISATEGLQEALDNKLSEVPDGSVTFPKTDGSFGLAEYDSRSIAAASIVPATAETLVTRSFENPDDNGGATYTRASGTTLGGFQSEDGQWWRLVEDLVTPAMFGAKGDGVADDTQAVYDAIAIGMPLSWGKFTYRFTGVLNLPTPTSKISWISDGATLMLDIEGTVDRAINARTGGHDFQLQGSLTLDCQFHAATGWYFFDNVGSSNNFYATGLAARNMLRDNISYIDSAGILMRGDWLNVMLIRPDVREARMTPEALDQGSAGIAGISIRAANQGVREVTILHPYIDRIYCTDAAVSLDQDGIKVAGIFGGTTGIANDMHFSLIGGKIRNCGGRGVKVQCEFGSINGTHFIRNATGHAQIARVSDMPEIDFQVGGGLIENIECRYHSSAPRRIVLLQGVRDDLFLAGAKISGVNVSKTGSSQPESFATINTRLAVSSIISIFGINYISSSNLTGNPIYISGDASMNSDISLDVQNFRARAASGFAVVDNRRTSGATYVTGRNISMNAAAAFFSQTMGGAGGQSQLSGLNVNVT